MIAGAAVDWGCGKHYRIQSIATSLVFLSSKAIMLQYAFHALKIIVHPNHLMLLDPNLLMPLDD